jgi:hypothetical protein
VNYVITARHHMLAPAKNMTDVAGWDPDARGGNGAPLIYQSRAEAVAALTALEAGTYYTRHGESGRPSYRIRTVASLPQYLALQL